MVHIVELNWGKRLYHKPSPSLCLGMLSAKKIIYSYVWPHNDKICEFTPFQARKRVFGPLRPKGPELGMVIMNLP